MAKTCRRGLFITFEGIDGVGKSTQTLRLKKYLTAQGIFSAVIATAEPGGTLLGASIRDLLLDPLAPSISGKAEALLYAADRAQHVAAFVRPALERGECVISDRYTDSSIAYQEGGRELSRRDIERLNGWATDGLQPDRTYLLDMNSESARRRIELSCAADRIELEPAPFFNRVRRKYLDLAKRYPDRIVVINGALTRADVWRKIRSDVDSLIDDWMADA